MLQKNLIKLDLDINYQHDNVYERGKNYFPFFYENYRIEPLCIYIYKKRFYMNEMLKKYYLEDGSGLEEIAVAERLVFSRANGELLSVMELLHALKSNPFLDLNRLASALNIQGTEDDDKINLMELLDYHEVNYESIVRKRILAIQYSRAKILKLLKQTVKEGTTNIIKVLCMLLADYNFLKEWNRLQPVFLEPIFMIDFYDIQIEEYNGGVVPLLPADEDDLIASLIDERGYKDKVLRFESFNN